MPLTVFTKSTMKSGPNKLIMSFYENCSLTIDKLFSFNSLIKTKRKFFDKVKKVLKSKFFKQFWALNEERNTKLKSFNITMYLGNANFLNRFKEFPVVYNHYHWTGRKMLNCKSWRYIIETQLLKLAKWTNCSNSWSTAHRHSVMCMNY